MKAFLPALLALVLLTVPAGAAELHVSAAASLTEALEELAADYEGFSGDKLLLSFGASSFLARQIQEGAPVDLFLSADEAKMDALEKAGLLLAGTRRSLLSNTLAVVVPAGSKLRIASPRDLASGQVKALALAEPRTVPAGIYARDYLTKLGLWGAISPKVVPTDNVRAALDAVESGNVEAGIVYKTDARISKQVQVAYEVPRAEGPRISYPFAVVAATKHSASARRFLRFLGSPAARKVFEKHGFLVQAPRQPRP